MTTEEALYIMRREMEDGKLDGEVLRVFEGLVQRWEWRRQSDPALQGFRLPGDQLRRTA
jgi:hypothetical protein